MELTVTISEDLGLRLQPVKDHLPRIIELGLREQGASPPHYEGLGDVLETLARLPSPEEVLALRPSPPLQDRIDTLLAKNRTASLSEDERGELQRYEYAERLIRIAKAKAALKRAGK